MTIDVLLITRFAANRPQPTRHPASKVILFPNSHFGGKNGLDAMLFGHPHHFLDALASPGHGGIDVFRLGPVDIIN